MDAKKLQKALAQWRDSLVNLSNRNKLLNYKKTRSSTLEFVNLSSSQVFERVTSTKPTYVVGTRQEDADASNQNNQVDNDDSLWVESVSEGFDYTKFEDSLFVNSLQREVDRVLNSISKAARREFLEKGINPLYLALGALSWLDEAGDKRTSPLIMVPVELSRGGPLEPLRISRSDEDVAVNPALALKLLEYGISLPTSEEISIAILEGGMGKAMDIFRSIAFEPKWTIQDLAVLSVFAFQKEAMYRDLLDNEELVLSNPVIGALSGGTKPEDSNFFFEPPSQDVIDVVAPPETTALVLDADSSQRAAISAASSGKSFVLDGPPGTGKSQTISNIIGDLIHGGKTVLFVSEKIVALEVVKDRLEQRGLGSFLFELHSHKATRKEVAKSLGEALRQKPVPPAPMSRSELAQARNLREKLNNYSIAANEVRAPLESSFYDVLGMLEKLNVSTPAPRVDYPIENLSVAHLGEIRESIERLGRHWDLFLAGDSAVWFGLINRQQLPFSIQTALDALNSLELNYTPVGRAADALRLNGAIHGDDLFEVLSLWTQGQEFVDEKWLICESLEPQKGAMEELSAASTELRSAAQACEAKMGKTWQSIAKIIENKEIPSLTSIGVLNAGFRAMSVSSLPLLQNLAKELEDSVARIDTDLDHLHFQFGITVPVDLSGLEAFIGALSALENHQLPPTKWIENSQNFNKAIEAADKLRPLTEALNKAKNDARLFSAGVLELEIRDLTEFFRLNQGFFARFTSQYRANKKLLMAYSMSTSWKQTLSALPFVFNWKCAQTDLLKAEKIYAAALCQLYQSDETDWDELDKLVQLAGIVVDGLLVCNSEKFEAALNSNVAWSDLKSQKVEVGNLVKVWNDFHELQGTPSPMSQTNLTIKELARISGAANEELRDFVHFLESIKHQFQEHSSIQDLFDGLVCIKKHFELKNQIKDLMPTYSAAVGQTIDIQDLEGATALKFLEEKLSWSSALRGLISKASSEEKLDSALTAETLVALAEAKLPETFRGSLVAWSSAWGNLRNHFSPEVHDRLNRLLSNFGTGRELLESFKRAEPEIEAWFDLNNSVEVLSEFGLSAVLEVARSGGFDPEFGPRYLLNSVLTQWAELTMSGDPRLIEDPTFGRSQFIEKYRELDSRLKNNAVSEIVASAVSRRPRSGQGQAGLIEREAEKKTRHIPVRELIDRSRDVIQALHPCFMMSPLAVSQYLPADMNFDVVIFDEASQVTPGDAINCIYRGNALIAAGDQKQLPPMSFFAASGFDDEGLEEDAAADFDSVLDLMKASGSFKSLTLNWHYRSRHEHLIAYSNASFYGSRLVTFPGAIAESEDLGVKFFRVQGIYRRSGGANNPIEAQEVAARVIHHFDNRPGQSLGVVAFSTAQRDAIENAVLLARKNRPDLDQHFEGNRQDGFFVNSLEAVQGDERDVIIFSIGYGPDETGKIYKNFGPLNRAGGERRLNVAITRARKLVEIVSSMSASELGEVNSEGARHLRKYLDFAERGPAALHIELDSNGAGTDSPFEDSVIDEIRSWGYEVQPQVGVAGYRIDIGVKHPNSPGVFILGVECDGAMYHSSKTARDRDRLRHEILEGLGWTIHHIWGTAWYRNRERELLRLKEVLETQSTKEISGRLVRNSNSKPLQPVEINFEENSATDFEQWTVQYVISKPAKIPSSLDLADLDSAYKLVKFVESVVSQEQPIHKELLIRRLRNSSGVGKVGGRILDTLDYALKLAKFHLEGEFIWAGKSRDVKVRRPSSEETREIKFIPPEELQAAIIGVVENATGITRKDLAAVIKEIFGWKRSGPVIEGQVLLELEQLIELKKLTESSGGLRLA